MIGVVAHRDGLFEALGSQVARFGTQPAVLLGSLLGVVAAVTVVLNLDTAVAFLTPVLILAARSQGADETAFLYGSLFMANAASLVLPGSNLTNLLVLAQEHSSGSDFAARMLPASLPPILITAVFVWVVHRHRLRHPPALNLNPRIAPKLSLSSLAIAVVAVLVIVLRTPALPVAAVGTALVAIAVVRRAISSRVVWDGVAPVPLLSVFAVAVALGTLARSWSGPAHLAAHLNGAETAALGAASAVVFNNLPAAVLFSAHAAVHPRALLIGLNLGPNLAVTGSLSSMIWFRAARTVGAKPSLGQVTKLGLLLVPVSIIASVTMLELFAPATL